MLTLCWSIHVRFKSFIFLRNRWLGISILTEVRAQIWGWIPNTLLLIYETQEVYNRHSPLFSKGYENEKHCFHFRDGTVHCGSKLKMASYREFLRSLPHSPVGPQSEGAAVYITVSSLTICTRRSVCLFDSS